MKRDLYNLSILATALLVGAWVAMPDALARAVPDLWPLVPIAHDMRLFVANLPALVLLALGYLLGLATPKVLK